MTDGDRYHCPFPGCDWSTSRPVGSDIPLTRVAVHREVQAHRAEHGDRTPQEDGT